MKKPCFFAISGVKNSGKTTLIEKLLPVLTGRGMKVCVIKHDGHDFAPDVPGTDSDRARKAGAFGTSVFSEKRYLLTKEEAVSPEFLAGHFPEADLILLEGFKDSDYPKLEILRSENSKEFVCEGKNLRAVVTDLSPEMDIPVFGLDAVGEIAAFLESYVKEQQEAPAEAFAYGKIMLAGEDYFFGPGVYHLLLRIQETGSIRAAAAETKLSYTKACKLLNRAEKGSGICFLERITGGKNGGRSSLTSEGRAYLEKYRRLSEEADLAIKRLYGDIFGV